MWIAGDPSLNTLIHLSYAKVLKAGNGKHGSGKNRHGARGEDLTISVPLGTIVRQEVGDNKLIEMVEVMGVEQQLLLRGGGGGRGNGSFVTPVNQEPLLAQRGELGEKAKLLLELKLLADVGIVGQPNAGKSTMVAWCSAARPKIASYPFTTMEPVLGMVEVGGSSYVIMEIPGLLENAHLGTGLGFKFLRHSERARLLWHMVDGEVEDPVKSVRLVNSELEQFSPVLGSKPMVVILNKIDIPEARERAHTIGPALRKMGYKVYPVSAVTGEGVADLLRDTAGLLANLKKEPEEEPSYYTPVRRAPKEGMEIVVTKEKDTFVVQAQSIERMLAMVDSKNPRILNQIWAEFMRLGLDKELAKKGVQPGDTIRVGGVEMEWH